mmetsp:Transcript_1516/g.2966  ORF Transcript_1516/g.2966 Transcript_1516/m.2966 type:complete len:202 (+) Transcript_1516:700-1305(+)
MKNVTQQRVSSTPTEENIKKAWKQAQEASKAHPNHVSRNPNSPNDDEPLSISIPWKLSNPPGESALETISTNRSTAAFHGIIPFKLSGPVSIVPGWKKKCFTWMTMICFVNTPQMLWTKIAARRNRVPPRHLRTRMPIKSGPTALPKDEAARLTTDENIWYVTNPERSNILKMKPSLRIWEEAQSGVIIPVCYEQMLFMEA